MTLHYLEARFQTGKFIGIYDRNTVGFFISTNISAVYNFFLFFTK